MSKLVCVSEYACVVRASDVEMWAGARVTCNNKLLHNYNMCFYLLPTFCTCIHRPCLPQYRSQNIFLWFLTVGF